MAKTHFEKAADESAAAIRIAKSGPQKEPSETRAALISYYGLFTESGAVLAKFFGEADRVADTVKALDEVEAIDPSNKANWELAKADLYASEGKINQAINAYREVLAREPNNLAALVGLGSLLVGQGNFPEAEALFRKALNLDPSNVYAMNDLGYSLAEQNKNLDEALRLTQRAVGAQPNNASLLDTLGWVCFKMGKLDEAEQYLTKATRTGTKSPAIFDHLGDAYKARGNSERAVEAWKMAITLETDPAQARSIKAKLDSVSK